MKKLLSSLFIASMFFLGSSVLFPGSANAEIGLGKKRKIIAASCVGDGSCAVVINGQTENGDHALDKVIYD